MNNLRALRTEKSRRWKVALIEKHVVDPPFQSICWGKDCVAPSSSTRPVQFWNTGSFPSWSCRCPTQGGNRFYFFAATLRSDSCE